MTEHEQSPNAAVEVVVDTIDLTAAAEDVSTEANLATSGRASRLLVSGEHQRAVLMAFDAGAKLADHDSPKAATLQVISGEVELVAGAQKWRILAGQLVSIPPLRHSLGAVEPSVVILTVAL
jgi:quercetin dioxygenase-like cupin family protein